MGAAHRAGQDELARRYPRATVIRDVLYVVDDRVATSAGIASGIDLALHLIAVRDGPAPAARVAREMVVYARRNGDEHPSPAGSPPRPASPRCATSSSCAWNEPST